ncbi:enoyl-CoA hydratase [Actinoplanes sp. SE50]|uniref:enoyl-CoA hydratase-related protein n=1 Tax=unclassified Actinoplanes TaxID=2626549 RepID=UPI00023ED1FF|nr:MULTISPECIES: enoyl-CoA hydratase-related protein [unclassified Actinoplanes]AEV83331.1 enoyl-CoA hydratase/isomerase [Actinoplanes sp. SE50/110]ATO81724.1 enoyl-CoA hydratase [Actinoplanes sp. SE50]SLL99132.1 enoyl-CoA hydratase [Actinoplanes sp. SE50/110]
MPTLDRQDDVFILDLGDSENRFHPDWLAAVGAALDEVEKADTPKALVTTASGKFYSNGLDLEWLGTHGDDFAQYAQDVQNLLARFLALPLPTVAAIQGHAFAAGAMLTLTHDFRVMRADRGFWCLPEVNISIPFTPGMSALIQGRLAPQVAHEAMTAGRRYGGTDARAAAIVDQAVEAEAVLPTAVRLAATLAPNAGDTLGTIKTRMYATALTALRERVTR